LREEGGGEEETKRVEGKSSKETQGRGVRKRETDVLFCFVLVFSL